MVGQENLNSALLQSNIGLVSRGFSQRHRMGTIYPAGARSLPNECVLRW